jgi:DNA polymerase III psi subunit
MQEWKGFLPPNSIVMAKPGSKPGSKPVQKPRAQSAPQAVSKSANSVANTSVAQTVSQAQPSAQSFAPTSVGAKLIFVSDPIQGQASQLLDRMIEAMGVPRADVSIVSAEAASTLDLNTPHIFVALGEKATQELFQSSGSALAGESFANLRSRFHSYRGSKLISVFHPSELLKSPLLKKDVWQDLQKVVKEMGSELPKK